MTKEKSEKINKNPTGYKELKKKLKLKFTYK